MKNKIISLLAAIVMALPVVTFTASAVQPRWSLINSINAVCLLNDNAYVGTVTADPSVYKMDIDIIPYEKGFLTGYKQVSSIDKTVYNYYHSTSKDYTYSSSKDYKVEITVTAYTQAGQTETVSIYNEYT